jgi:hypothetical protein
VQTDDQTYIQHETMARMASRIPRAQANSPVPTNKSWTELTPEQQEVIRRLYKALAPGDEPPYPLKGPAKLYAELAHAVGRQQARGELLLYVLVGADGKAISVSVAGKPDPETMRVAAAAVVLEQYKPALCDGKPCEMLYPFSFNFILEL